jgi:hypothetical protein
MKLFALLFLLVSVCGCSPQKSLARRLEGSDRVVVTYPSDGLSITVMGQEVDKVLQAIASGKKESYLIQASPYLEFRFFKGGEHLATITTCAQAFWIGQKPYSDTTGTLEALMYRYREEHPPMLSR